MSRPDANTMFRAAQILVRQGQPVFPCRPSGEKAKAPLTTNGFKDATLDIDQIKKWLRARRDAALGIPTGIVWDVLDVDTKGKVDGRAHLSELRRLGLLNGCQRVVRTPSGGWHLYFHATPGITNKAKPTLGLDVRGKGGYVLAPPSFLENAGSEKVTGPYEDLGATSGCDDSPLFWDLITSNIEPVNIETKKPINLLPSERRSSLAALRDWVARLVEGERNTGLHWAVCRCIDNGLDPHELVEPGLLIGLSEDEILLTVNSALKRAGVTVEELDTEVEAMFGDTI